MKETFGQRFLKLRKKGNLKQEDIAAKLNISAQAVSKWENDLSAPDISALPILADLFNISIDELLGREIIETKILPEHERVNVDKMLIKINVLSNEGDKVKINLPVLVIKYCIESGLDLPNVNGNESLKCIDFNQIFEMINAGVIGKLVEIESADGDIVTITVE